MENRDREMLMRFIQQESNIKERWQIVELFEEERQRFEEERKTLIVEYEKLNQEYTEKTALVSEMHEQIRILEQSLNELDRKERENKDRFNERETRFEQLYQESKTLEEKLIAQREEFKTLNLKVESLKVEHIVRQNALKVIKEKRDTLLESAACSSLHEVTPLRQVEVMGKGGKIIKATPAKNYYAHSVLSIKSEENRSERELLEENEKLQAKNIDLEIENGNMHIEIRELKNELQALNQLLTQKKQSPSQTPKTPSTKTNKTPHIQPATLQNTNFIEQKIEALGQAVEPTNFKENTGNEVFEALLEDEPFSAFDSQNQPSLSPSSLTQTQPMQSAEEEILEVYEAPLEESTDIPAQTPAIEATSDLIQEDFAKDKDELQQVQDDSQESVAIVQDMIQKELNAPAMKSNPFLNENVRIITPQGLKTPDEVL